ncbi:MAG: L-lactate permease [Enhydrobacter sp.]|nr:MAG: L-lactate permease [Enhydrobacter sp.]
MDALLALLPILLILALMVGRGWSAAMAGSLGLVLAVAVALAAFGFGQRPDQALTPARAVGGSMAEALFVAATILWIVFPALCIYELQARTGGFLAIRAALGRLSDDPRLIAILVAWFFASFMEGAAGFGTPVALAAPILASLGFPPVQAVALALVGHAAAVSFGAVGTPVFAQATLTGLGELELSRDTALLHAALAPMLLVFLVRMVTASSTGLPWGWMVVAAAGFLVPYLAIAALVGPELPSLAGALAGGALFAVLLYWRRERRAPPSASGEWQGLWRASLPYVVLTILIVITRLVQPLRQVLQDVVLQWSLFGAFNGSIQPLYHPGTMLLLGFVVGTLLQGRQPGEIVVAAGHAARRLAPVVVALVAMVGLSRVMVHAGMVATLADVAAAHLVALWPLVVPAIGVLGSFVTGSATTSNILLADFQAATARALDLPAARFVAAQGVGAAIGNIVCPHNVVAGAATVGLLGREGEVLRRTVLPCLTYAAAGGLLLWLWVVL